MPRDRESIHDILDAARLAIGYAAGVDKAAFLNDTQLQDAIVRRLEIMGEAAKRVTQATRDRFPQVPWKDLAGMRDRAIHRYDTVDLEIVWDTLQNDLPALEQALTVILRDKNL